MRAAIILTALMCFPGIAFSTTIIVPDDYTTIQAAINAAVDGDIVLVKPGTYVENIDFKGKGVTLESVEGPHYTVIDGGSPSNPDYGSVVTFDSGEGIDSQLIGFTLTNGTGTQIGTTYRYGGGIYCANHSSPFISNNIIVDNHSYLGFGGGIYLGDSDFARIKDSIIIENYADCGGGIYTDGGAPVFCGIIIGYNEVHSDGGGVYLKSGAPFMVHCLIIANENIYWDGGGIWCGDVSDAIITNCNIVYNVISWDGWGGGIYVNKESPMIVNCIIRDNKITEVLGNAQITYSNVGQTWPGTGNINAPAQFVDPFGPDNNLLTWQDNDFHITYASPCLDAGTDAVPDLPGWDFEGDPRIAYRTVDIGVDEFYTHLYYTGDATPGGSVELKFIDLPGASPVGFWIAFNALEIPIPGAYGNWWLFPRW